VLNLLQRLLYKVDALEMEVSTKFDALKTEVSTKVDALTTEVSTKVDALTTQTTEVTTKVDAIGAKVDRMEQRGSASSPTPIPRTDWYKKLTDDKNVFQLEPKPYLDDQSSIQQSKQLNSLQGELTKLARDTEAKVSAYFKTSFCSTLNKGKTKFNLMVNNSSLVGNKKPDLLFVPPSDFESPSAFRCLAVGDIKKGKSSKFSDEDKGQVLEYGTSLMNVDTTRTWTVCFLVNTDTIQFFRIERIAAYEVCASE
jgi:hypothetical protein